jgi:hypothetical protein
MGPNRFTRRRALAPVSLGVTGDRQVSSPPGYLPSERAGQVEGQMRPHPDQLKPTRTALGVCHACTAIVYKGDSLAMAGGHLLHGGCCPGGLAQGAPPPPGLTPSVAQHA